MNKAVKSIMITDLITVHPNTDLLKVRSIFMDNKIHHLPVLGNNGFLLGLLTTYDLWKNEIAPIDYSITTAQEVMSTNLAKIGPTDKIGTAAEIFLDNRFHALPVVDNENILIGMVTSHDILMYEYIKAYPKPILFRDLIPERLRERRAIA